MTFNLTVFGHFIFLDSERTEFGYAYFPTDITDRGYQTILPVITASAYATVEMSSYANFRVSTRDMLTNTDFVLNNLVQSERSDLESFHVSASTVYTKSLYDSVPVVETVFPTIFLTLKRDLFTYDMTVIGAGWSFFDAVLPVFGTRASGVLSNSAFLSVTDSLKIAQIVKPILNQLSAYVNKSYWPQIERHDFASTLHSLSALYNWILDLEFVQISTKLYLSFKYLRVPRARLLLEYITFKPRWLE